ncbi:MAG: hypothetical protein RL026_310 [Pseudomonadota bacterium]|jgi:hypothetical protein
MNLMGLAQLPLDDVTQAIQLSLAPVFLLNGIGVLLAMLTARLARIVDRARGLEQRLQLASGEDARENTRQLRVLSRRSRLMNLSITLCTTAALMIALVVALLFVSALATLPMGSALGLVFIGSMLALVGGLMAFLLEVRMATVALRIGPWRD